MIVLIVFYIISLSGILVYASYQFYLALVYKFGKKKKSDVFLTLKEYPMVTVQLPIYNEKYVIKRLLKCIVQLDYPPDKLEIQILDDSDDETSQLIDQEIENLRTDFKMNILRRKERTGYKAGALKAGLTLAKGEFIAIFDSDFLPKTDFLKKCIPFFQNEKMGVVQTRWGFINKDFSILTSLQAFALDTHFTIEQMGRNKKGHFINFNGTAGIWRKTCVLDAGNWEATTLTEDLDLSYRAQMKGWEFNYLEEELSPSELPVTISALKKQQFRWNKGGAQCFKKHLGSLLKKKDLRFSDRVHGLFHLMNSSIYLFVFSSLMLSFPVVLVLEYFPSMGKFFYFNDIFIVANFLLMFVYGISYFASNQLNFLSALWFLPKFFLFLIFSFGLMIHNTFAVLEGWFGMKSAFVRTPKFNILDKSSSWEENKYVKSEIGFVEVLEFVFGAYFLVASYYDLKFDNIFMAVLHFAVAIGFFIIWSYSFGTWIKFQSKKIKN